MPAFIGWLAKTIADVERLTSTLPLTGLSVKKNRTSAASRTEGIRHQYSQALNTPAQIDVTVFAIIARNCREHDAAGCKELTWAITDAD